MQNHPDREKMAFEFERDGERDIESMWVIPRGDGTYVIDNIPFYVKGVAADDIVVGEADEEGLRFKEVAASGGHSTLRVIVFDRERTSDVCEAFVRMGCEFEGADTPGLIAIDVPPTVSWSDIQAILSPLAEAGTLDWEEAAVSRHHLP